jgi:hypothetical protein
LRGTASEHHISAVTAGLAAALPRLLRRGLRRLHRPADGDGPGPKLSAPKPKFNAGRSTAADPEAVIPVPQEPLGEGAAAEEAAPAPAMSVREHVNTKFVMDGAYMGRFATLNDFYRGPEALIGVPNPRRVADLRGAEPKGLQRICVQLLASTRLGGGP